jgi:hypothetical protein
MHFLEGLNEILIIPSCHFPSALNTLLSFIFLSACKAIFLSVAISSDALFLRILLWSSRKLISNHFDVINLA